MLRCLLPALLACLECLPLHGMAQTAITAQPDGTWTDLNSRIDRVATAQLRLYDTPGITVALVGDGQVQHLEGYGVADIESRSPVIADQTLFGTGSVSKVLTWTAVMQLVEQGTLDLDRDINDYLDGLRIPATWPQPVTLAHLMTHTAGFEQRVFGFYARDPGDLVPLPDFLAGNLPARVYPPGEVSAYSNYGAALAGHIVSQASGLSFESYIEDRILDPLGMTRSTFRQPPPPSLAPDLATGYTGKRNLAGYGWYQAGPSAALRTTAADMARFMLAHLQQGRAGDSRILQPDSSAAMQRRQFSNHPAVSGITPGFQELHRVGHRILWQPGDTLFFTAALFLLPELKLGLFVAYNRAGVGDARLELLDAILARLGPGRYWPALPPAVIDSGLSTRLAGHYRSTRTGMTSLEQVFAPFKLVRVREVKSGVVQIRGLAMANDAVWTEQSPGVFRDTGSEEIVVFDEDVETGDIWLFEGNAPAFGYSRLPWHATPYVQSVLLAVCALIFLTAVIAWSLHARRARQHAPPAAPWSARLARPVAAAMCLSSLGFLAGMLPVLIKAERLLFGIPPVVSIILLLPVVSATLAVPVTVLAVIAWRNRYWSLPARLHFTLVAAAGLVFLGVLRYWQLL